MKRTYYHLLEKSNGLVAHHGYFLKEEEANSEAKRLSKFYSDVHFEVYPSPSKKEPETVNI